MIRILTAKSNKDLAYTAGLAFGPFSPDGTDLFDELSFRSSYDSLEERPGIYGENHVNHREISALLYQDPWFGTSLPKPWTYLNTRAKNSSGQWTSATSGLFSQWLRPSYPWLKEDSRGLALEMKLGPTKYVSIVTKWSYDYSSLRQQCNSIDYTESTCNVPAKGDTVVKVTSKRWILSSSKDGRISSPILNGDTVLRMVDVLIDFAKRFGHETVSENTQAFPFFSEIKRTEKFVSPRDIYIRLQSITADRYEFPKPKSHGDLAGDAIATLDSNTINMFEFAQGLKRPQELIPKLKNLSKLKTHAGNYLGYEYGILPTISDLETLKDLILNSARPYYDSNNYQVLTAGDSAATSALDYSVTTTNRIKICINPADPALFSMSERLRDIGGFPSIDNLWELIPYSFVIDWFLNVGDMLEAMDRRFRMASLPIIYGTTSSKSVVNIKQMEGLAAIGASGECTITLYSRSVSENVPVPTLNFEVSNSLPSHWLEAGALIVTARK